MAIMRYHPELVERAVFSAVEGPDHTIKLPANGDAHLNQVSKLIALDPEVGKVLPNFRAMLIRLIKQLAVQPMDVGGVRLSSVDIQLVAASLLGSRSAIASIPRIFGPAT